MHESVGQSDGRFDYAGALLAGAGGSCLMWAFVDLGEGHIGLMQAALIGAGIILLAVFVWHEGRTPHPILPLSFFHHAGYASSISSSFLAFFSGFGLSSYLPLATNAAFHENRAFVGLVVGAFTIGWSMFAFGTGRLVHRIGERLPSVIGIVVHILGLLFFMVAFEHGLGWVIAASLVSGAGMGLLSPALTVVVQNSVPVARMGSATTSQQFIRQIGAALGVSAFVLAATVGGFRLGLLLMIAVSAGTFACVARAACAQSASRAPALLKQENVKTRPHPVLPITNCCSSDLSRAKRTTPGSDEPAVLSASATPRPAPWTSTRIRSAIFSASASIAPTFFEVREQRCGIDVAFPAKNFVAADGKLVEEVSRLPPGFRAWQIQAISLSRVPVCRKEP